MRYDGHYLYQGTRELYDDICVEFAVQPDIYNVTWTRTPEQAGGRIARVATAQRSAGAIKDIIARGDWMRKYSDHVQLPVGV